MKIEKVTVEDAEELLEIYAPYVENTAITFEYDVPSKDEFEERIKNISVKYPYIKAVHEGKIVGYAYAASFKDRRAYDWSVETTIYVKTSEVSIKEEKDETPKTGIENYTAIAVILVIVSTLGIVTLIKKKG